MSRYLLRKMEVLHTNPVSYYLYGAQKMEMNSFLGKNLKLVFTGEINCIKCGANIPKTYGEGFCYNCLMTAPEADVCKTNPEKCQAHEGIFRDKDYAEKNCLQPHYVYLSKTSNVKVGVTRQSQIPTRWIDQGATEAIKLAKTPYRFLAGVIETYLKQYFSDKTSWQKMLKCITDNENLETEKNKAISLLADDLKKFIVNDNEIWQINFPLLEIPNKITSIKIDKTTVIDGTLTGIKGQYLIFDNEFVVNIRTHSGYIVEI